MRVTPYETRRRGSESSNLRADVREIAARKPVITTTTSSVKPLVSRSIIPPCEGVLLADYRHSV